MNGKVNGTMDNPIDTSAPNPPDSLQNEKEAASEGCENPNNLSENSNHTEDSNHLDSESSRGDAAHSTTEDLENDISNGSDSQEHRIELSTEDPELPENENSNIIFLENNCGNSNESYSESMPGRQVKSDANDETLHKIMVEKNQEAEKARALGKGTTSITRITEITQEENSEDSDMDSSEEDMFEGELRGVDTLSINSDSGPEISDDRSQEGIIKIKDSNIIILENEDGSLSHNGNSHDSPSPEVQEIVSDNDDCVVAEESEKPNSDNKVQLRRSSRAIKRKRYNDDMENGGRESDVDVPSVPSQRKNKPIVINDTKALVEMAARQMKSNQNHTQKKEPTVVIINTNKLSSDKPTVPNKPVGLPISSSLSAQSLYQSIVARGTTVTPVSSKSNAATQSSTHAAQPSILPSLTDDMFVVEAPSFIVPYVYEKPSVKPFREFVDLLGKELDEQKAKEEKEIQEKEKKEKEKKEMEKQEKKEKGEDVESEEEAAPSVTTCDAEQGEQVDDKKKKKKEKKKRGAEEDDVSWDGSTSTDSEDEILMSDEENKTIIIKDKVDSIEEIKDVTALTADKVVSTTKSDNYFDCSLGKFFINIGLSLVQEYVQSDLLKQQTRKLNREKKSGHNTKSTENSIASLIKNIEFSKENNAPYSFPQKKCEFCSFKTESNLAMAHHLETPHMKNNVYKCNFCAFEIRSPHDILYHMEAEHNIRGKLERAPAYHQCANCLFEDNGKGKLARHLIPCAKKFKPETNLAPALEWEPPAKIPKITRSRNNMMGSYQNTFSRPGIVSTNQGRQSTSVSSIMPGGSASYRPRGRNAMSVPPRAMPVHGVPILRGGVMVRHNAPVLMSSNYPVANNAKPKSVHQPSISITPLPRQPPPVQLPPPAANSKSAFVICEICDGYIKDLEQLRNHMQWIHKVKIHPKMIYNRPPLNCQKCQFRFFTDQGLERHLLGTHGLVTSSMQEAANKGKDAGRCPVCGRVYQWKLLNHVARDHNLTLKPAHLSYKCTVCTATFGMYKQFENHVYSAHSVVAKRVMDKSKSAAPAKATSDSLLKPLKINDEITIIPQPVKAAPASAEEEY